ncbi:MAG: 2-dehydro-3-deoxy-6-phosphogalactonate aldolase [Rhodospirillaceae bacterium]|nr:2-dehydro-3-deoxy-6-phosphogalactonate aldolase [Rhodospirillaceae bacterium]
MSKTLQECLEIMPLVAVLRGIEPDQAEEVGLALLEAGFSIMEVTLNSPKPMQSIRRMSEVIGDRALVGAGTVLSVSGVYDVIDAGGNLIVMPHTDTDVIKAAKESECIVLPGVMTPSEAFAAIGAGADGLKLFPAEVMTPAALKAMRAVLPKNIPVLAVGSITPDNMAAYWKVGANGFGLGGALFSPGKSTEQISSDAKRFVDAVNALRS